MAAPTRRAGSLASYVFNVGPLNILVPIPSAAVVGDVALISFYTDGQGYTAASAPGWAKLGQYNGTTKMNLVVLWKVIASGDPGSTVAISGVAPYATAYVVASVEVWQAANTPTVTFDKNKTGTTPSVAAGAGSVPLYIAAAYDDSVNAPASVVTPAGVTGSYVQGSTPVNGLAAWYGPATTGSPAPAVTSSTLTAGNALFATIILPALTYAVIAGTQAAADQTVQIILAGVNAAADTTLVWTP